MHEYFDTIIVDACKTLFGREANITRDFVQSMGYDDLKSAFRKKAFETHPDLHISTDAFVQRKQTDIFMGVRTAYDVILNHFEKRGKSLREGTMPKTTNKTSDCGDKCTTGVVPPRRLEIGGYLYYRGCIPYPELIKALAWQKRQRPIVGVIAKQWEWLTDEQIRAIVSFRGQPRLFGDRAVHLKFLTPFKVRTVLAYQRTQQKKIGQYFVENGLLTEKKIEQMVEELKRHNAQLSMPMRKSA
jgi:hypothetical protein